MRLREVANLYMLQAMLNIPSRRDDGLPKLKSLRMRRRKPAVAEDDYCLVLHRTAHPNPDLPGQKNRQQFFNVWKRKVNWKGILMLNLIDSSVLLAA